MSYINDVLALNPTAHYKLDEVAGVTATDATGNGNAGTYVGTHTKGQPSLVYNSGTCVNFSDGYLNVPNFNLSNQSFTVAGWVRFPVLNLNSYFFMSRAFESLQNFVHMFMTNVALGPVGELRFNFYFNDFAANGIRIFPATRHFLAFRYDAASDLSSIWVDGKKVAESNNGPMLNPGTETRFFAGPSPGFAQRSQPDRAQHLSVWAGTAVSDANLEALYLSGIGVVGSFYTDFNSYPVDVFPADWEIPPSYTLSDWFIRSELTAISGKVLKQESTDVGAAIYRGLRWLAHPETNVFEGRLLLRPIIASGIQGFFTHARSPATWIEIGITKTLGDRLFIGRIYQGDFFQLATVNFPYDLNDRIYIRAKSHLGKISAKAWKYDDPEPASWMLEDIDIPAYAGGEGWLGVYCHSGTVTEFEIVDFGINAPLSIDFITPIDDEVIDNDFVLLSWTAWLTSSPPTYTVELSIDGGPYTVIGAALDTTSLMLPRSPLLEGVTLEARVRAYDPSVGVFSNYTSVMFSFLPADAVSCVLITPVLDLISDNTGSIPSVVGEGCGEPTYSVDDEENTGTNPSMSPCP